METNLDKTSPATSVSDMTVQRIFESLTDAIVGGGVPPGSLINSVEIAQRFGTSRTPVREALLLLSQYGLVTLSARRRPQVANVSGKAIRDLYALRTALHACIAEAIVEMASDTDLEALRVRAAELVETFDHMATDQHLLAVEGYLSTETELAGNDMVRDVLDSLKWKINWFRRVGMMSRHQLKMLALDRLRVADAYLERDTRLAKALTFSMLKKAGGYCEENFMKQIPG